MPPSKRKMGEIGEELVSAAVGDVVGRTISAAVLGYQTLASVEDQLQRLQILVIMLHAVVEEAEGVHIRSWWLRRWLWRLRDSALDGDEVLRLFQQRRAAEDAAATGQAAGAGARLWNAARCVFQSAKNLLFPGGGDDAMGRLSRTVARLEMDCTGISDFTNLLDIEIRRSNLSPHEIRQKEHSRKIMLPAGDLNDTGESSDSFRECSRRRSSSRAAVCWATRMVVLGTGVHGSDSDLGGHHFFFISHRQYVPKMMKIGMLIVKENIWRALVRLKYMAGGVPPPPEEFVEDDRPMC